MALRSFKILAGHLFAVGHIGEILIWWYYDYTSWRQTRRFLKEAQDVARDVD